MNRLSIARIQNAYRYISDFGSSGYILIFDISIGHGSGKILNLLALRADHHLANKNAPTLQDVHCISVGVSSSWTGENIAELLSRVISALGHPVAFLKDGGTDLGKATRIIQEVGCTAPSIDDLSHVVANILKHEYGDHPMFKTFLSACSQASKRLKQTILACLAPPKVSTKARFMNLYRLVKWAEKILKHSPKGRATKNSMVEKLRVCLGELPQCKFFVKRFLRDASALIEVQRILKNQGLCRKTFYECEIIINDAIPQLSPVRVKIMNWMRKHLAIAEKLGLDEIGMPISSDSIESLFGVTKMHGTSVVKDANRMAARIPAFCGPVTIEDAQAVIDVSVKDQKQIMGNLSSLIKQRHNILDHPGTIESIVSSEANGNLELAPEARNHAKNETIQVTSASSLDRGSPAVKEEKENIFPVIPYAPVFSGENLQPCQ